MTFQERHDEGPADAPARIVCTGWNGVHTNLRVIRDGAGPFDTHGMCVECDLSMPRDAVPDHVEHADLPTCPAETPGHPMSAPDPRAAPTMGDPPPDPFKRFPTSRQAAGGR